MSIPFKNIEWCLGKGFEHWVLKHSASNFLLAHVYPIQAGQEQLHGYCVYVQEKNNEWWCLGSGLSLLRAQQKATLRIKKVWGFTP